MDHICIEPTSNLGELTQTYLNIGLEKPLQPYPPLRATYATKRARNGTIIIETPYSKKDIFSLPPDELKRLAQGIIWRDMHFKGVPMKAIAEQEGYSEAFVRHTISKGFNILQSSFKP